MFHVVFCFFSIMGVKVQINLVEILIYTFFNDKTNSFRKNGTVDH